MISRYTRPEMGRIWADENKFRMWLAVEVAATETLAEAGLVPPKPRKAIREKGDFELERIHQVEAEVKHDVIAFTTAVAEKVGPAIALAALRADVERRRGYGAGAADEGCVRADPAKDLKALRAVLKRRAFEFKDTPMIGRTHGIHAEPITFGLKLANWYSEMERNIARFERAAEEMRVGKLSGAVGTFAHLEPEYEVQICERLGLKAAADIVAGDPARPPRDIYLHACGDRQRRWTRSRPRSATCSAPRCARRKSFSAKNKRARRRCRTSGIR